MADKKNDKKVQEALKEQELDQVTGGMAEMPARDDNRRETKITTLWQRHWNW